MKIGVFHPLLNVCGGAEWVAVNIINNLKKAGHDVVVLNNEKINRKKIKQMFGTNIEAKDELVLPFQLFNDGDLHNVYSDAFRLQFLKRNCDLLIDTQSNSLLPGADITYIHFPLSGRLLSAKSKLPDFYFNPYLFYERIQAKHNKRLLFVNSKYTAEALRTFTGARSTLLYPPLSKSLYLDSSNLEEKENVVVSLSRLVPQKRCTLIPYIAKLTDDKIRFKIVGHNASEAELVRIYDSINKNNVSDRVEVITNVSRAELQKILGTAKAFLHVTLGEHFGVAVAEAMASGCVPIVCDSGGPKEFVPEHLRFTQIKDASKKIEKVIFQWTPNDSKAMIELARSFDEDSFSINFNEALTSYLKQHSKT